jgi:hypothetical protein
VEGFLQNVVREAGAAKHEHKVSLHDIGSMMKKFAEEDDPDVQWDRILDADERVLRHLRAMAFLELKHAIEAHPDVLHLVDLHLAFRWTAYLTRGFEPHILEAFNPYVRAFINVIEDLPKVQERLKKTAWGERTILELLLWRDEELFLTNLFADTCGRVDCIAVARGEPAGLLERLIWHPEIRKVYLSFPITGILEDEAARREIADFRDRIREFLIVFDPYACRDYDETYKRPEMQTFRKEVGEATVERDFRFIDQADAVVVYYPSMVASKGVDAEMRHARKTGKPIYLYAPQVPGGGPFAVPPSHFASKPNKFITLLMDRLKPE